MADWFTADGKRHRKAFPTIELAKAHEVKMKTRSKKEKARIQPPKSSAPTSKPSATDEPTSGKTRQRRSLRVVARSHGRK
jgi:hypothetical protein